MLSLHGLAINLKNVSQLVLKSTKIVKTVSYTMLIPIGGSRRPPLVHHYGLKFSQFHEVFWKTWQKSLADLRGAPGTRAPPGDPNSFIFMQILAKIWKIIATLGVGAPPGENPGSATENCMLAPPRGSAPPPTGNPRSAPITCYIRLSTRQINICNRYGNDITHYFYDV